MNPQVQDCSFCRSIAGRGHTKIVAEWPHAIALAPPSPVTPGHVVVVPRVHVRDAAEDPATSGATMVAACEWSAQYKDFNIITSRGAAATQTVFHLHIHIVPGHDVDGLALPWSHGQEGRQSL